MLNELRAIERGLAASGLAAAVELHPDVNDVGKCLCVRVRLTADGVVDGVTFLDAEFVAALWTLRDGKKNSFPAVKHPIPDKGRGRADAEKLSLDALSETFAARNEALAWTRDGMRKRMRERLAQLASLRDDPNTAAVPAVFERFLVASASPAILSRGIAEAALRVHRDGGVDAKTVRRFLTEGGTLCFDVARDEFPMDAGNPKQIPAISRALADGEAELRRGVCALTGREADLADQFPQPNLPIVGPTLLFSKNPDLPAVARYGLIGTKAFDVARESVGLLRSALDAVTTAERRFKTWDGIPGERPKQSDLLIAFVAGEPDLAITPVLADRGDKDDEQHDNPEATYERRTQRVIDALKAKRGQTFSDTPVVACVMRKVDLGNHKVILHRATTAGHLERARDRWLAGATALPPWLRLPLPGKAKHAAVERPPHVAPLSLPRLSRVAYVRGGLTATDVVGMSAVDALGLFLGDGDAVPRARRMLRLFLDRYGALLSGAAHALRRGGIDAVRPYNRDAALRAVAVFGVLLNTIKPEGEDVMSTIAFKLGQFLSVADRVHLGYCADVRKGATPPALLGNSVLAMAQTRPHKALAALSQRWKPYEAWASLPQTSQKAAELLEKDKKSSIGWAIRNAVSQRHRSAELARELFDSLREAPPKPVDDEFRAELLLGYVAGLEPAQNTPNNEIQEGK